MPGAPSNGCGKAAALGCQVEQGTSALLQAVTDRTRAVGFLSVGCQPRHMLICLDESGSDLSGHVFPV